MNNAFVCVFALKPKTKPMNGARPRNVQKA